MAPAGSTSSSISYNAITEPSGGGSMAIKACNPTTGAIDDATTHFNLLVINAN